MDGTFAKRKRPSSQLCLTQTIAFLKHSQKHLKLKNCQLQIDAIDIDFKNYSILKMRTIFSTLNKTLIHYFTQ